MEGRNRTEVRNKMPYSFSYYDSIVWIVIAAVLGMIAQGAVKSTFNRYSREAASAGITAAQAAQTLLQRAGIYDVTVTRVSGNLTDHYAPREKVLRLSDSVYDSTSIAALGVAAHETGHAMQHAQGYAPLEIRNSIVPLVNFGSSLSMPLLLAGLFLNSYYLALGGVVLYGFAVAFQLITLPVEINASRRALRALTDSGLLVGDEPAKAKKVLKAAASTYLAAALAAVAQLLRLLTIVGRKDNRR